MKKSIIKIFSFIIVFVMMFSIPVSAKAEGIVTYDGNAQKFIFEPGSEYSVKDLFTNFKSVMPGDSLTQKIMVKNVKSNGVKVKIYVRSLGGREESVDFLSQLHMTVTKSADNNMAYMFDAAADQTAGMTDWVLLGTLYSGGVVNLDVTLDVPIGLGNEYQNAIGYIDWEFRVDELPVDPDDPVAPATGDDLSIYIYAVLAVLSGSVFILLFVTNRCKKEKNNRFN